MVPAMRGCCTIAHYANSVKESDMLPTLSFISMHIYVLCMNHYQIDLDIGDYFISTHIYVLCMNHYQIDLDIGDYFITWFCRVF